MASAFSRILVSQKPSLLLSEIPPRAYICFRSAQLTIPDNVASQHIKTRPIEEEVDSAEAFDRASS
jgi:hypothetical protein